MELNDERLIPASIQTTWEALNDPLILKDCIPGCESLERTGEDAFAAVVAMKIGPVSARFKGVLKIGNMQPPRSYTINFDGQGGVAGFGRGSADVVLTEDGANTRLQYSVRAQVGGKLAQIGSRLIDAAAGKLSQDFFSAFEQRLQREGSASGHAGDGPENLAADEPVPQIRMRQSWLVWLAGAAALLAAGYWVIR